MFHPVSKSFVNASANFHGLSFFEGCKTLTAERAQFKEWLGKLKNAYSQVRPGSRIVFDSLEKIAHKVNEDGKDEEEVPQGPTGVDMNGMDFDN